MADLPGAGAGPDLYPNEDEGHQQQVMDEGIHHAELIRMYFSEGEDGNVYHPFVLRILKRIRDHHEERARLTYFEELDDAVPAVWSEPLSLRDLKAFSNKYQVNLASRFIHFPTDLLLEAETVLREIVLRECSPEENASRPNTILISLHDNPDITGVNELQEEHVDAAITIEGVVIRASNVKPLMSVAAFQCTSRNDDGARACDQVDEYPIIDRKVIMPQECISCRRNSLELCYHQSKYQNRQVLKIQDIKSMSNQWSQNQGIVAFVHDPLIDVAKPGDRIQLTGLFRTSAPRVRPTQQIVKAVCRTYIDVIHIDKIENVSRSLTSYSEQQFRQLSNIKRLLEIFAPGIAMLDQVKLGLLCSLVGGTKGEEKEQRSSIHVLLCGDPATAKSQLLSAVKAVAERSVYVCGRGSSASGLTASVVRDAETNEFLLEPGAVVVADKGMCLIDEFDKVDDSARIVLNEVMEQQTVSVAKAGIVCSLNARTSIIASANPIASRFDRNRSIMENLNMPLSLLSRFDLVYLLTDPNDVDYDRAIASSLLSHWDPSRQAERHDESSNIIAGQRKSEMELLLSSYLAYAKSEIHPTLPNNVKQLMIRIYCDLRTNSRSTVVTPRQLKALIRIAEGLAKLELKTEVTEEHVKMAQQLISTSTEYLKHHADDDTSTVMKSSMISALTQAGAMGIAEGDLWDLVSAHSKDRNMFGAILRLLINERLIVSRAGPGGTVLTAASL